MSQTSLAPQTGQAPAPFFVPRRLGHANLFVTSYERAAEFYTSIVGFKEQYRQPDNMAAFVSNGNTYHDLGLTDVHSHYCTKGEKPGTPWHIAFEVETEEALVEGYNRSIEAGVKFAFCMDHDAAHSIYKYDPDGNLVEIYADVVKDWQSVRHGIIIKQKPEWIPGITNVPSTERNYPEDPELIVLQDAVFRPRKITHAAYATNNYEDMFEYYTEIVGLVPFVGSRTSKFAVLRGAVGSGDLTLYRARPGLTPGMHHVGFEAWNEADLDRAVAALPAHGIKLERDVDHPARRVVIIKDPDGLPLHFHVNRQWTAANLAVVDEALALDLL